MQLYGLDSIQPLLASDHYVFKFVANESGVIFFPHSSEHRDLTQSGIRYADNYAGNALAAMVKPGRIEIRFHEQFSDERVRKIVMKMLESPELFFASQFEITYQNRVLIPSGSLE